MCAAPAHGHPVFPLPHSAPWFWCSSQPQKGEINGEKEKKTQRLIAIAVCNLIIVFDHA
jgi:hypothetical protein